MLVERHRVGALVAASSTRLNLPPAVVDALAEDESVNAANYLRSRAVLDRLEARFSAEAIDWAVLKGLAIAERYYERPSLREMIDVDLLVDRDRIADAERILADEGFERYHPRFELDAARRANFMALHSAFSFIRKRDGAQLDLHWRTVQNPRFLPQLDAGWRDHVVRREDRPWPVLREDVHFTYVLVHGAKHGWARLKWLVDIDRMLAGLDASGAEALVQCIHDNAIPDLAGAALTLCETILGSAIPPALAALSKSEGANRLCALSLRLIEHDIPHGGAGLGDVGYLTTRIRHSLGLSSNRGYRRQALLLELARPTDLGAVPLPAGWGGALAVVSPLMALGRTFRRSA